MPVTFGFGGSETSSNEVWIRSIKEGEIRVRFLDEYSLDPNRGWMQYRDHWMPEIRQYVPCSPPECIGCAADSEISRRRSRRFLVNVLTEEGVVRLYKLPFKTFKVQVDNWYSKFRTMTDRDYDINRIGKDKDSIYQLIPTKNIFRLEKEYKKHNPIEVAQQAHDLAQAKLYGPPEVTIGVPIDLLQEPPVEEEILVPDSDDEGSGAFSYTVSNGINALNDIDLSTATKEDLVAFLTERGVEVPEKAYRSTLVNKIRALQKS